MKDFTLKELYNGENKKEKQKKNSENDSLEREWENLFGYDNGYQRLIKSLLLLENGAVCEIRNLYHIRKIPHLWIIAKRRLEQLNLNNSNFMSDNAATNSYHKIIPEFEIIDADKVRILNSPLRKACHFGQNAVIYMMREGAQEADMTTDFPPEYINDPVFSKYEDLWYEKIDNGKYQLTDEGGKVALEFISIFADIISGKITIDDAIDIIYTIQSPLQEHLTPHTAVQIGAVINDKDPKKIKEQLETIGSFKHFERVGNFQFITEKYRFRNIDELEEYLLYEYFQGDFEDYNSWKDTLLEFRTIFSSIHDIFSNSSKLLDISAEFLTLIIRSLFSLEKLIPIADDYKKRSLSITGYEDKKLGNIPLKKDLDFKIEENLDKYNIPYDIFREFICRFEIGKGFGCEFPEKAKSIFKYNHEALMKVGFSILNMYPYAHKVLSVGPKALSMHQKMKTYINKQEIHDAYLLNLELKLAHELFHDKTLGWKEELLLSEARVLLESIAEFRLFGFYLDNYERYAEVYDLYILRSKFSDYYKYLTLLNPYYFKGTQFLLALFDIESAPENVKLISAFCETNDSIERFKFLLIGFENTLMKSEKALYIRTIFSHSKACNDFYKLLKTPFTKRKEKFHSKLIDIYEIEEKNTQDKAELEYFSFGLVLMQTVMDNYLEEEFFKDFILLMQNRLVRFNTTYFYYFMNEKIDFSRGQD